MNNNQSYSNESIVKYKNSDIEVRIEKTKIGCWETWIKDIKTGKERKGYYVPGDPKYFDFDPKTEYWVFKG